MVVIRHIFELAILMLCIYFVNALKCKQYGKAAILAFSFALIAATPFIIWALTIQKL